jgi:methionyl-tRNA synthetase
MYNLLESIRVTACLLESFMPTTMPEALEQIGASAADCTYDKWNQIGVLPADVTVKMGRILFARIDMDKEIAALNQMITDQQEAAKKAAGADAVVEEKETEPEMPQIAFDDFMKCELRVAKVLTCEPVKRAKKLLKLTLDDGKGERTIASGIAKFYKPDQLIGHNVVVVANLKPAMLCGVESCGMLLASDMPDGSVKVLFADDLPVGGRLR